MNNMKKPKIRFKGFTDDWEQRKWCDTVDISTEMVDPTSGEYDDMPHIAPGNIESFTGRILDNVKSVKEEQLISGKYRFRPGDVVYGKINPQLGKYFYASVDGLTSADAYVFNGKNGVTQKFLFSLLQTEDFFKYSVSVSKRSGMPKINRDELNAYGFLAPKEEEQEQIGRFLLEIDKLITLHQRKYEKLQIIKKSMLENCFPKNGEKVPKIRFSGFTGDWEQRKLADVAEIIGGGTPSTSNPDYWDGDIDWYAPAEIGEQIFAYGSVRKITKEGLIHSSAKILPAHKTVLFTSRAGIGNMAILKRPAATNQGFQSLVCHDDIDPYFMFSMGDSIKAKAERVAAGSTFAEISGKKLGELEFMFPDTGEQKAIGVYFKNLDHLITLHQSELEKLQKIKKSMLERMFV